MKKSGLKAAELKEIASLVKTVREKKPLVHHITNYVTVNDCANITLAIGASPVMADDIDEAAEFAAIASAVVLNMGTLNQNTIPAMISAGKAAKKKGVPVIFDPVGAGASRLRNYTAGKIVSQVKPSVIRGNISEIRYIAGLKSQTKGVDAAESDIANTDSAVNVAEKLSKKLGCVVAVTGAVDVISYKGKTLCIENGHPMLGNLTGTGCMCTSLIGSFCGAASANLLVATAAALLTMGIAGEIAYKNAGKLGNGSFRAALHDAVSFTSGETIAKYAKIHEN